MSNMNSENNSKNTAANTRTVLIFAVCITVILLVSQIAPIKNAVDWIADILFPVFVGVILAYIINPLNVIFNKGLYRVFQRSKKMKECSRKRISNGIAVTLSMVVLFAAIALLAFLIIPEFLNSLSKLVGIAPSLIEKAVAWFSNAQYSESVFIHNFGEYIDSLVKTVTDWLGSEVTSAVTGLVEGVVSVVNFMFDFLIAIVVCVYALLEKKKFVCQFKKLLYAFFPRTFANDVLDVARYGNDVFGKFISGKLLTSTIVGIVTFIFMSIMGMPYAFLSAGIIAITNIIPFFGPFIGGIPTAFIVLITDFRQGVIYIVFLLILQQIEGNIIEPMIMEDKTGVSKFWVTFALLLCGGVFGIAGMIFSVPLFAVLFYAIKLKVERSLAKRSLPIAGADYLNVGSIDPETGEILPTPEKEPRKKLSDAVREWRNRIKKTDVSEETEETNE